MGICVLHDTHYIIWPLPSNGLWGCHNGMATYDAETRPDFWKLQVTTSRNITGGHGFPHFFPMMPRHNLRKTHKLIASFCKEWGVKYHETDLVEGTIEVLQHLSKVSDDFMQEFIEEFPAM